MANESKDLFRLILVEVVRAPLPTTLLPRLLQLANLWLRRRAGGFDDLLHLVGVGFANDEEFRAALLPYGLDGATRSVVDQAPEEDLSSNEADVGDAASIWVRRHHAGSLPLASWPQGLDGVAYPTDIWWMGLEASRDVSKWRDSIASAVSEPFASQAATWALLFDRTQGHPRGSGLQSEVLEGLSAAAFARWLAGFSAAAGDSFFDYSYGDVVENFGLDPFITALEGAQRCPGEIQEWVEADSPKEALTAVVRSLLQTNDDFDATALQEFFGSSALLFFTLYTSLYPQWSRSALEACMSLTGLESVNFGDIERPWRFVDWADWSVVDENL